MIFKDFEKITNQLAQILELENRLLSEIKAREALQYLDEKTRLLIDFFKGVEFYKSNKDLLKQEMGQEINLFVLKIEHILKLAQENEIILKKVNQKNERLLKKIIKKVQKVTTPIDFYTARGRKNDFNRGSIPRISALSLNSQI